ncbi:replication initiation protein [Weissella cibaria]|uniref:replication initiation protein n=1 Tax=Weissella cibaria TaxID=137591 RepID=UPI0015F35512|nr:replication initiation protein [Weissella cibaria]MBA5963522.1 replication initiation protein [Weissella cibaria]
MTEHLYKSVKSLADELGISRTTLYKRAKLNGIELTGNYTSQQIEQLKTVQPKMDTEQKTEHFFQSEIQRLSSQLTVKDEQIAELNQQLKQAQKLADQAQQLQLKAQLQLEAEQQKVLALETELQQEEVVSEASAKGAENKKGFWRRIFG